MKKMQCEVCGSTEIKKISNDVFECQSCGIQYSIEEAKRLLVEISGTVKIDHSDEIKNNIERGDQYVESGDVAKAKEYYNKALDLDAGNTEAKEKVTKAFESEQFEDYYIVEPDINPEDNVKDFLKQLATTDNIACDIYKEIKIERVTEKFYTLMFMEGNYKCDWSLTACHRYYENETVYKEKYDPSTRKYYKEPETQKVERIDRVPMHGTKVYDAKQLVLGSKNLNKDISFVSDNLATQLIENFLQLQTKKYHQYTINKVDIKTLEKENGVFTHNAIPLDTYVDDGCFINNRDQMKNDASQIAVDEIAAEIDCDFCEGVSATSTTLSLNVKYICFPIQIIEYTYKDKKYVAVSDLLSHTTTMPMVYPCDVELTDALEVLENQKQKAAKSSIKTAGLVISMLGLLCMVLGLIFPGEEIFLVILFLVLDFVGLFTILAGIIVQKSRTKKFQNNAKDVKKALFDPRVACLEASRDKFFEEYTDYASAKQAAAQFDCMQIKVTRPEFSCAGEIRKKMAYVTNDAVIDNATTILEYGIKTTKKKRNKRICWSVFGGIILGVLGAVIFSAGVWHYSIWFLALLLNVLGFGFATIGSVIIVGNSNRKIIDLQNCLTMYNKQKTLENEFEQPQDLEVSPVLKQWTPERIEQKVTELSSEKEKFDAEKELQKNNNLLKNIIWQVKKHKKLSITIASVLVVFLIAIVSEAIATNASALPYEESLYENSFVFTETDSSWGSEPTYTDTETYVFSKNGTYEYTKTRTFYKNPESPHLSSWDGTYKVRFELFSGEPQLVLGKQSFTVRESQKSIYEFVKYGDYFKLTANDNQSGENSIGSSSNNDSTENIPPSSTQTNADNLNNTSTTKPTAISSEKTSLSTTSSKPSSSTQTTSSNTVAKDLCADGHTWEKITETVHHEEEGHYDWVVVKEAYQWYKCPVCGKKFEKEGADNSQDYYQHFDSTHTDIHESFLRDSYNCGTVDEKQEKKWVVDQEAYDETVVVGYKCEVCEKKK